MSAPAPMVAVRQSWTPPHLADSPAADKAMIAVGKVQRALAALLEQNPAALMLVRDMVAHAVKRADYPELVRVPDPDPAHDEDEWPMVWECPWCGSREATVVSVDVSERWTESDEDGSDDESRTVSFFYDSHGEHHGSHLQSVCCDKPVSLPDGWDEE